VTVAAPKSVGRSPAVRLKRLIPALGVAQIISWGTLFYAIAVLGESMRNDLALSSTWLFGAFTLGLLLSGAASPIAGRLVDAKGGRFVLAWGSVIAALALATIASAGDAVSLFMGWALAGIAMAACLYDPAFVTLHQLTGSRYRSAVTVLTLFGGLASTVFWPASQWLLDAMGWRDTLWIYSALHLGVCLPLHLVFVPKRGASVSSEVLDEDEGIRRSAHGERHPVANRGTYFWLAAAFSIAAFLSATLSAHLIAMLKAVGMTPREAVIVSSLIGPMQVAGRVAEFAFARRFSAIQMGALAFALMTAGMICLALVDGFAATAFAFAILYGWSNGVMTIVRGTVPAVLFGPRDYGALLGRLALPAFVAKAIAPVAFASILAAAFPRQVPLWGLVLGAAIALAVYRVATGDPRR